MLKALAAAATLILASSTVCAQNEPIVLSAGLACPGFDLGIEVFAADHRVTRQFFDKNGNLVRLLNAGQGNTLKLTNLNTGASLTLKTDGSVEHILQLPNGLQRWTVTGHNVLILFPGDTPSGPSTTLYVGRLTFTQDANFTTNIVGKPAAGTATNICAALSV